MEPQLFYVYGLLLYVPIALALSLICGWELRAAAAAVPHVAEEPKRKKAKKKESLFPPGKCAYCLPCQRYLLRDNQIKSHEIGADHMKRASGLAFWYEFRDYDEGQEAKKAKQLRKPVDKSS